MSSKVPKSKREKREPRKSFEDFTDQEQKIISAMRTWFPGKLYVFGSRATGRFADDSDFDFGVSIPTGRKKHKAVFAYLERTFGIKIETRPATSIVNRKEAIEV